VYGAAHYDVVYMQYGDEKIVNVKARDKEVEDVCTEQW